MVLLSPAPSGSSMCWNTDQSVLSSLLELKATGIHSVGMYHCGRPPQYKIQHVDWTFFLLKFIFIKLAMQTSKYTAKFMKFLLRFLSICLSLAYLLISQIFLKKNCQIPSARKVKNKFLPPTTTKYGLSVSKKLYLSPNPCCLFCILLPSPFSFFLSWALQGKR